MNGNLLEGEGLEVAGSALFAEERRGGRRIREGSNHIREKNNAMTV